MYAKISAMPSAFAFVANMMVIAGEAGLGLELRGLGIATRLVDELSVSIIRPSSPVE